MAKLDHLDGSRLLIDVEDEETSIDDQHPQLVLTVNVLGSERASVGHELQRI